jgi:hypothetical protein
MAEYIEREAAKEAVKYIPWCDWKAVGDCLDELPAADVVSLPVVRQIQWERDIAMQQLEEHGIPFCGKADVVPVKHGRWKLRRGGKGTCDQCNFTQLNVWDYDNWQRYCGCCGAKMEDAYSDG